MQLLLFLREDASKTIDPVGWFTEKCAQAGVAGGISAVVVDPVGSGSEG